MDRIYKSGENIKAEVENIYSAIAKTEQKIQKFTNTEKMIKEIRKILKNEIGDPRSKARLKTLVKQLVDQRDDFKDKYEKLLTESETIESAGLVERINELEEILKHLNNQILDLEAKRENSFEEVASIKRNCRRFGYSQEEVDKFVKEAEKKVANDFEMDHKNAMANALLQKKSIARKNEQLERARAAIAGVEGVEAILTASEDKDKIISGLKREISDWQEKAQKAEEKAQKAKEEAEEANMKLEKERAKGAKKDKKLEKVKKDLFKEKDSRKHAANEVKKLKKSSKNRKYGQEDLEFSFESEESFEKTMQIIEERRKEKLFGAAIIKNIKKVCVLIGEKVVKVVEFFKTKREGRVKKVEIRDEDFEKELPDEDEFF